MRGDRKIFAAAGWGAGLAALSLALSCHGAVAAGPFDGQWKGEAPPTKKEACVRMDITLTVADNIVTGQGGGLSTKYDISGKIAPDGSFQGMLGREAFVGKFAGGSFDGVFHTPIQYCPKREVHLERVK